jgi:hypothetical protein
MKLKDWFQRLLCFHTCNLYRYIAASLRDAASRFLYAGVEVEAHEAHAVDSSADGVSLERSAEVLAQCLASGTIIGASRVSVGLLHSTEGCCAHSRGVSPDWSHGPYRLSSVDVRGA